MLLGDCAPTCIAEHTIQAVGAQRRHVGGAGPGGGERDRHDIDGLQAQVCATAHLRAFISEPERVPGTPEWVEMDPSDRIRVPTSSKLDSSVGKRHIL